MTSCYVEITCSHCVITLDQTDSRCALVMFLGFLLELGWVWKSQEALETGVLIERYRSFDIKRTPVFVWLTMILVGYAAHLFRQRSLGYYGLAEIFCGLLGGFIAIGKLPLDHAPAWFGLLASAFIIVRGAGNVGRAVDQEAARSPSV
jgi:hypothetical protein